MLAAAVPAAPPVIRPVTAGAAHVYVVPAGTTPFIPSAGTFVKVPSLHTTAVMSVTAGIGLTVTVTVNDVPVQVPVVGVTEYIAVCAEFVGLVSVPVMFTAAVPAAPPVIPPDTVGADQL